MKQQFFKYCSSIIILFLILTPVKAYTQTAINGLFKCSIENLVIKQMIDGKSRSWDRGNPEGFFPRKDDSVFIKYFYNEKDEEGKTIGKIIVSGGSTEPIISGDFMNSGPPLFFIGNSYATYENGYLAKYSTHKVFWSQDFFKVTSGGNQILLVRYFKNDWHGYGTDIIKTDDELSVQLVVTDLSCRHKKDALDEIAQRIDSAKTD